MKKIFKYIQYVIYIMLGVLAFIYGAFCYYTSRKTEILDEDSDIILKENKSHVIAFWHSRIFLHAFPYMKNSKKRYVIISNSIDGIFASMLAKCNGVKVFSGSTGKITSHTLKSIINKLKEYGTRFFITTDGPVGPRFRVQIGTVQIASMAGVPIIPVTYSAKNAKIINSWDRFLLIKPFSKLILIVGSPVKTINQDGSRRKIEEVRLEVEKILQEITWKADKMCGIEKILPTEIDKRGKRLKIK